jgi:hypothetical protein
LSSSARQLLLRARQLLIDKGWTKGDFSKSGRYCALGALNKAAGMRPMGDYAKRPPWYEEARNALQEASGCHHIPRFNDDPKTKKQDVLDLFCRAAARCKE